jgi:N-acetylglucosamine-6-phosphate deacetylase
VATLTLIGGRAVTPDGVLDADVLVRDGRIVTVGPTGAAPLEPGEVVELDGRWLLPGFVDLHVHGGNGADCTTTDPEEVRSVAAFHAAHGTTALLATTVVAPPDDLLGALEAIRAAAAAPQDGAAEVLGAHLEGPFLSPDRLGAMDGEHVRLPDPALAQRLLAGGGVRLLSLAPELPGALALVHAAVAAGVRVALAHTDATYDEAIAAVEAGARSVTHAFNAMRPLDRREPGVLGAALADDRLVCELICDGIHVHPANVRLLVRAKGPARTALVTDAIAAAGLADGPSRLGTRRIVVEGGRATLPDRATLAGSTLTLDQALRNVVEHAGVSVPEAAQMAATTPAQLLGIDDRKGLIAPDRDADLVVLDDRLHVTAVLARGHWALRASG